jgi:tRNA modification GTPase
MRRSIEALKTADIILWVRDLSKKDSSQDRRINEAIARGAAPTAVLVKVFNKSDLRPAKSCEETADGVIISCKTGLGVDALNRLLVKDGAKMFSAEGSAVITSVRHYSALLNAHKELSSLEKLGTGETTVSGTAISKHRAPRPAGGSLEELPFELAAEHLRGALNSLADILGETTSEEILADIFKNFCVGK